MKKCPKCKTEYPDSLNFCLDCGKKLEPIVEEKIGALEPSFLNEINKQFNSLREEIERTREEVNKIKTRNVDEILKEAIRRMPKMGEEVKTRDIEEILNEVMKRLPKRGVESQEEVGRVGTLQELELVKNKINWIENQSAQTRTNMQMLLAKMQKIEREFFILRSAIPMVIE